MSESIAVSLVALLAFALSSGFAYGQESAREATSENGRPLLVAAPAGDSDPLRESLAFKDREGRILRIIHHFEAAGRPYYSYLCRNLDDTHPDFSFGAQGVAMLPGAVPSIYSPFRPQMDETGSLFLVTVPSELNAPNEWSVLKFSRDGLRDESFANHGVRNLSFEQRIHPTSILLRPQGKILLAGVSSYPSDFSDPKATNTVKLVSLLPDGNLDQDFGSGGRASTDINESLLGTKILSLDANLVFSPGSSKGDLLAAVGFVSIGERSNGFPYYLTHLAVLRFGGDGKVSTAETIPVHEKTFLSDSLEFESDRTIRVTYQYQLSKEFDLVPTLHRVK